MAWRRRQDYAELFDAISVDKPIVEAVGDVVLCNIHGAPARVRAVDLYQNAPEDLAAWPNCMVSLGASGTVTSFTPE